MAEYANTAVEDWSAYPALPGDADEQIRLEVERHRTALREHHFGDVYESKRIVRQGVQTFAAMGGIAYELRSWIIQEGDKHYAWQPAILNGTAFQSAPNEGRGGMLHWIWSAGFTTPGWRLVWSDTGWIHEHELGQSPAQVMENIAREIDAGQTPITGLSARREGA